MRTSRESRGVDPIDLEDVAGILFAPFYLPLYTWIRDTSEGPELISAVAYGTTSTYYEDWYNRADMFFSIAVIMVPIQVTS